MAIVRSDICAEVELVNLQRKYSSGYQRISSDQMLVTSKSSALLLYNHFRACDRRQARCNYEPSAAMMFEAVSTSTIAIGRALRLVAIVMFGQQCHTSDASPIRVWTFALPMIRAQMMSDLAMTLCKYFKAES